MNAQIRLILIVFSVFFALLWIMLFKMQIVDYGFYRDKSERNRIRPVILEAPRGKIFDRKGVELAGSRLSFDCFVLPQKPDALEETLSKLSPLLNVPVATLAERYERKKKSRAPVLMAEDLPKDDAIRIEEESHTMTGVFIKTKPVREYALGEKAAHVTGYVGAIGPEEYDKLNEYGYLRTDRMGRGGLEDSYDSYLRGKHGASQFEVNSLGKLLRVLGIQEREEGRTLELTIDAKVQAFAYDAMKEYPGALAVMELQTGGLIAAVSTPAYDPNVFIQSSRHTQQIRGWLQDKKRPMSNRLVSGEYPPGSTFKIVTAAAGLQSNSVNKGTRYFCPGSFYLGNFRFGCWRKEGHGSQNIIEALQHSCDVYFYNTGKKMGVSWLEKESFRFGLGKRTGVDLPGEKTGLVPGPEWKERNQKEKWFGGDTINYSIGQGLLLTTPIQVLRMTAVAATKGKLFKPYVVRKVGGVSVAPGRPQQVSMSNEYYEIIREGMNAVVQTETGTGKNAYTQVVKIAGKTGTAQAHKGADHAWFVGYAPLENPQVAIVVFHEHGGSGGMNPTRIAKDVLVYMHEQGYLNDGTH